jgi:hypothetical protein
MIMVQNTPGQIPPVQITTMLIHMTVINSVPANALLNSAKLYFRVTCVASLKLKLILIRCVNVQDHRVLV